MKKVTKFLVLSMVVAILLSASACAIGKGSLVMMEKPFGTQFDLTYHQWSDVRKCQMSMSEGDILQVEISRESGKISLDIRGKNGSEPYSGKNLQSGTFTVTVTETDDYEILLNGDRATGKIVLTNLSR